MWLTVILASLFAALLNATGSLIQRHATGQLEVQRLFRHTILTEAFRNRQWLLGGSVQVAAFLAQALALHSGSLVVVEPVMTTDLVFLMLLLKYSFHVPIGRREWLGALAVSGGLSLLLASANPRGGNVPVAATPWLLTGGTVAVLVLAGAFIIRRAPAPHWRAVVGGITAGAHFSLTAALIKLVMLQLQNGIGQEFSNWPLWALAVVGLTSLLSLQSMYGAGPLAISWPLVEITEAFGGVIIGLTVFGDLINTSPGALAAELTGATMLAMGIVLLAASPRLRRSESAV